MPTASVRLHKWGQICFLTGKELAIAKRFLAEHNCSRMLGFELLNHVINLGGQIKILAPKRIKITDIDSSKDIIRATEIWKR